MVDGTAVLAMVHMHSPTALILVCLLLTAVDCQRDHCHKLVENGLFVTWLQVLIDALPDLHLRYR